MPRHPVFAISAWPPRRQASASASEAGLGTAVRTSIWIASVVKLFLAVDLDAVNDRNTRVRRHVELLEVLGCAGQLLELEVVKGADPAVRVVAVAWTDLGLDRKSRVARERDDHGDLGDRRVLVAGACARLGAAVSDVVLPDRDAAHDLVAKRRDFIGAPLGARGERPRVSDLLRYDRRGAELRRIEVRVVDEAEVVARSVPDDPHPSRRRLLWDVAQTLRLGHYLLGADGGLLRRLREPEEHP